MANIFDRIYLSSPILIQNLLLSTYGVKILLERYGKEFISELDFLEQSQYFSEQEISEYQNSRLNNLIKHAYDSVPYYRNIFNQRRLVPEDIKIIDDLQKLPILTKKDISENFNELISSSFKRKKLKIGHTSGTTGSPLEVLWDRHLISVTNAMLWRFRKWAGLEQGERFVTIFGRITVPISQKLPPFWRYNFAYKQLWMSSFHLTKDNLKYYFGKLREFKPVVIESYPSNVFILAKYLESIDEKFPVQSILTTSETLHQYQRELIEERFCCRIFDYYGMAERVIFATECERHEGHHLNSEYGITELLSSDGAPVKQGEFGRLVCTSLHNFGFPLIRYATNDVSALEKRKCSCGRILPLLHNVTTKAEDIVTTSDGRYISSSILTHPFKPLHGISESQIIQEDLNHFIIKIVKNERFSDSDSKHLLTEMHKRLGHDISIQLQFVDEIQREGGGKFRWVISKVPLTF